MSTKNITLVLGTARAGRNSARVFKYLQTLLEAKTDVSLTGVDVRDHLDTAATVPPWGEGGADERSTKWKEIVIDTDTFIFILPEYNHGYPGEWKLLVDSLYDDYKGKDAYLVTVSGGVFSGVRVADHVKPILIELNLLPRKTGLHVGRVKSVLDETGEPTDDDFAEKAEEFVYAVANS